MFDFIIGLISLVIYLPFKIAQFLIVAAWKLLKFIVVLPFKILKYIFVTIGKILRSAYRFVKRHSTLVLIVGLVMIAYGYFTSDGTDVMLHSTAKITDLSVGYLTESAYAGGNFDDSAITKSPELTVGSPSYMVIDFTVKTLEENEGNESISLLVYLNDGSAMDITIQEAPTGTIDKGDDGSGKWVNTYYKILSEKKEKKSVRMIVKLVPRDSGSTILDISLSGENGLLIKGKTEKKLTVRVE